MKYIYFTLLVLIGFCGCGQATSVVSAQSCSSEASVAAIESGLLAGNAKTVSCSSCGRKFDDKVKVCPYDGASTTSVCKR